MYVYKLNENIILYKHSSENNQSSSHSVLARVQHAPGHRYDVHTEDLKNHVDSCYHPVISLSLLIRDAHHIISFLSFSSVEIGWLYQSGILLLGYPVLQMIII